MRKRVAAFDVSCDGGQLTCLVMGGVLALCAGCSDSGGLQKTVVRGAVSYNGELVPNGEIRFYPIEGTAGSVSGGPIKDGQYVASSRGGVPVGTHRVEISGYRASTKALDGDLAVEGGPAVPYIPAKFNSQSELRAEIERSTKTLDFNLED